MSAGASNFLLPFTEASPVSCQFLFPPWLLLLPRLRLFLPLGLPLLAAVEEGRPGGRSRAGPRRKRQPTVNLAKPVSASHLQVTTELPEQPGRLACQGTSLN